MLMAMRIVTNSAQALAIGVLVVFTLGHTCRLSAQTVSVRGPEKLPGLSARKGEVSARVIEETTCCPKSVTVTVEEGGIERALRLTGRVKELKGLALVGDRRLLLAGELPRGGTNLLIGNLVNLQQEAEIWTYGYGISPSGRWLAFQTHYPRMALPEARRSIFLLYDLTKPPTGNRSGPETEWPEPNLGQLLFPEENVELETWSIFTAERAFGLNSPFLWSETENRLVFLVGTRPDPYGWPICYVVNIHLSDRGRVEAIRRRKLTEEKMEMPFKTTTDALREEERPLCLIAHTLEWAEEGMYERIVAEPGTGSDLGRKVWIEVP